MFTSISGVQWNCCSFMRRKTPSWTDFSEITWPWRSRAFRSRIAYMKSSSSITWTANLVPFVNCVRTCLPTPSIIPTWYSSGVAILLSSRYMKISTICEWRYLIPSCSKYITIMPRASFPRMTWNWSSDCVSAMFSDVASVIYRRILWTRLLQRWGMKSDRMIMSIPSRRSLSCVTITRSSRMMISSRLLLCREIFTLCAREISYLAILRTMATRPRLSSRIIRLSTLCLKTAA